MALAKEHNLRLTDDDHPTPKRCEEWQRLEQENPEAYRELVARHFSVARHSLKQLLGYDLPVPDQAKLRDIAQAVFPVVIQHNLSLPPEKKLNVLIPTREIVHCYMNSILRLPVGRLLRWKQQYGADEIEFGLLQIHQHEQHDTTPREPGEYEDELDAA